ncbi:MAG: zinc-ribbon domain-containing protein [Clostridia bacterium]|nr:zinc-ribbon domain-containing protein [Clostridia bacterium]
MEQYECKSCGARLENKSNHCPYCGAPMNAEAECLKKDETANMGFITPDYPCVTVKKKKQSFIAMLIGGVLLCVFAVVMVGISFATKVQTPVAFSEVSLEQAKDSKYICFDKLVIVDVVAEETEETEVVKTARTTAYLLIGCALNKDGTTVSFPLYVSTEHSELTAAIFEYLDDENAYVGDLVVKAAVKVTDFSDYAPEAEAAYNDGYAFYESALGAKPMGVCLEYAGEDADVLIRLQKDDKMTSLYVGCGFAFLGGLLVVLYFVLKKKARASEYTSANWEEAEHTDTEYGL